MIDIDKKVSYCEFFEQIKEIYSWLEDDISKQLFNARLLYNHTELTESFYNNSSDYVKKYMKLTNNRSVYTINPNNDETVVIYGGWYYRKKIFSIFKI